MKLARHYRDQSQAEEDSFSMTVLRDNLKYDKQTFKQIPKMALQELLSKIPGSGQPWSGQ